MCRKLDNMNETSITPGSSRNLSKVWSLNRWSNKKKEYGVSCAERYTPKSVSQ
jgi:hypothetical protein